MLHNNYSNIKDMHLLLPALKLGMDIEEKLAGKQSEFALKVKKEIESNTPYLNIVKAIKSVALENKELVEDNIGLKLTDEILNFA